MANHRTPTVLKVLRGNPGKRALKAEPMPASAAEIPEPPPFLSAYGREEWARLSPELYRLGLLTIVDVNAFAAYCQAYSRWRLAEEALADGELVTADQRTRKRRVMKENPLVHIAAAAAKDMISYAGQFGLTPVARSRISLEGLKPPKSKFDGLLAG